MIRQPIVTVCGHVDHGKTTLLDKIRGSKVAAGEAGGITQKISFTNFPAENIKKSCFLLDKNNIPLKIPGFLFIDTPGHQAFTNLRKRGGSLADLAIVVIDINEGLMPQTQEVLQIMKQNKTPFIIALNKIDNVAGFRKIEDELKRNIEAQAMHTQQDFQQKLAMIISALNSYGFNSDLFWEVKDFTQKIALVPISAKTGEGIPELLMVLCGLSQKFLVKQLSLGEKAKGVILEIKKEKNQSYTEAIVYDGKLKHGDEIAVATFNDPIIAKIRVLEEVLPLSSKFVSKKEVVAATGIKMQLTELKDILPGMPFQIFQNNLSELSKEFKKEISNAIETDEEGIIIKAESLGSLEAMLILLKQSSIPVLKAGIGNISKYDISQAKANEAINPVNSLILGFNVDLDEEAKALESQVKIIKDEIVYKLIDETKKFQEEKRREIEKQRLMGLSSVFKLEIMHKYVFRNSNPAIFGIKVLSGKLKSQAHLINELNDELGRIKAIQHEKASVEEASSGMEVAISIPGLTFDRQLKNSRFILSDLTEYQFKEFKKNKDLLSDEEKKVLMEIAEIKRRTKSTWGV